MDASSSLRRGATGSPGSTSRSRSSPRTDRYGAVAIGLHWLMAVLVIAQVAWGWGMQAIAKGQGSLRADAFNLHKSVGLVILALVLVRLAWRATHPAPPLDGLPAWQRRLARGTQATLYAALVVMPLAGYLGSAWSGYPVKWFGLVLPAWASPHPALKAAMSEVHLGASVVLVAAMLLHIAGALRHAMAGDGVMQRMWPVRSAVRRRADVAPLGR